MAQFREIEKSKTLLLNEKMKELQGEGRTVYKFGFGESPFLPPLRVREALASSGHRKEYTPVRGLPELREKIAAFHSEIDGYPIHMEQILVAPGSKPLLYSTMLAFQDATVFVPAPAWVSYAPHARMANHEVHAIHTSFTERWRVTPVRLTETLEEHQQDGKTNILVLNYPGNPDGLTYSRAELIALTEVLRQYEVWVLSDEIYGLLHHEGLHVSLASVYPERTLVTTGLSKWCGAGGWRLGAQILPADAPKALVDAIVGIGSETYSCAPAPIQAAACTAYSLDEDTHLFLSQQRAILKVIGNSIYTQLANAGIAVHPPQGAFYLLLDFSPFAEKLTQQGIKNDSQLCAKLLDDTGVALLPGSAFVMNSTNLTARLAYVDFDGDGSLDDVNALSNPEQFLNHYCSDMQKGVQALCDWLNSL